MVFWLSGCILWVAYAGLIGFYRRGWRLAPAAEGPAPPAQVPISVLVPARNEARHLPGLLAALRAQRYPQHLFEVLVLNDHSTDATATLAGAAGGNVRLVALANEVAGKKAALTAGVREARGELVVTTDADCLPGPGWLELLAGHYATQGTQFIAAPVRYRAPEGLCAVFQTLDFLTLQGITAASVATGFHSMCNGANLAYTKAAFEAVDGFAGIDRLASGDDLLLMHKIASRHPGKVAYCKHPAAIVDTDPAPGWRAFWQQRVRWASKSAHYDDKRIFRALLLVYGFNLWFVLTALAALWDASRLWPVLVVLLLKTTVELRFLAPVARFFGQQRLLRWFPLLQPLHILYTVLVGALSQVGSYEWKGRRVR